MAACKFCLILPASVVKHFAFPRLPNLYYNAHYTIIIIKAVLDKQSSTVSCRRKIVLD